METIISWIMTVPKGTMLFSAYYAIHSRYNLLLQLKTNNQMWLAGA